MRSGIDSTRLVVAAAIALASTACIPQSLGEGELRAKESALNKLAASLESVVRFQESPQSLTEDQLKSLAFKDDPAQLEPFKNLLVRVRRQGILSSVLICTADGVAAYWEDAGCTPRLDLRLWDKKPAIACQFTLDLAETCR